MKLAFDEHIPTAMVKVFQFLASQRGIQRLAPDGIVLEQARDYAPDPTDHDYIERSDVPWINRFSSSGGVSIISGDKKMRSNQWEREALVQARLVVFFFDPEWNKLQFCAKSAVILHWWPKILEITGSAPKPSFWRIPSTWKLEPGIVPIPHTDLRLERIERQKAAGPAVRAKRAKRPGADSKQTVIEYIPGRGGDYDDPANMNPPQDSQHERPKEAAREAETADDPAAVDRVFAKVVPPKVGKPPESKNDL